MSEIRGSHNSGRRGSEWWRRAARALIGALALGGLLLWPRPAAAQTVQFSSVPDFNTIWDSASLPEIEWGEPVWIRVIGLQAPDEGQQWVFRFWRARTAVPDPADADNPYTPYGFAVFARGDGNATQPAIGFRIGQSVVDVDPDPQTTVNVYYQGILQPVPGQPSFRGPGAAAGEFEEGKPGALSPDPANLPKYNPENIVTPATEVGPIVGAFNFSPGVVMAPGEWRFRVESTINGQPYSFPHYEAEPNYLRFAVRNPLAIMQMGQDGTPETAAGRLWDYEGTGLADPEDPEDPEDTVPAPQGNGSPGFETRGEADKMLERTPAGVVPTLGDTDHGRTSLFYSFFIADRSRWGVEADGLHGDGNGDRIRDPLRVRIVAGDLNPNPKLAGDPERRSTNMVDAQGVALVFGEPDYPAIPGSCLVFRGFGGQNPVTEPAPLALPDLPTDSPDDTHTVTRGFGAQLFEVAVKVPRYQPDTYYQTGGSLIDELPPSQPIRVWIDTNGDGLLNTLTENPVVPPAAGAAGQPYGYEEAYREFDVSVYVPPDFRFTVAETTVDLGKHPHGTASLAGDPEPAAVRAFTVRNDGNVNLVALRVAHDYLVEGSPTTTPVNLYCPETDYDLAAGSSQGLGLRIPPVEGGLPHIWWSFAPRFTGDPNAWTLGSSFRHGYLAKAQVGAGAPTTLEGVQPPGDGSYLGPRIGVVPPFGTPVGTYANRFLVYEDTNGNGTLDYRAQGNGAFQALEPISQDALTLKITITDRQLTEEASPFGIDRPTIGFNGSPDNFPRAGDAQPAALRFWQSGSLSRRLALFWTSNRNGWPGNTGPAPSWHLYHARTLEDPASTPRPFWGPTNPGATANPPEAVLNQTLFPALANPNTDQLEERYVSPHIAVTANASGSDAPAYLFFQATAHAREAGTAATHRAYGLFCVPLVGPDMRPSGAPLPVGGENFGVVRHSPRGLSYRAATGNTHYLWGFWHGGPENAWQGYYSYSTDGGQSWSREERLPIDGDFTCVQDITPVHWSGYLTYFDGRAWQNGLRDLIDVYFSGFSKYRRNSDIYLARLDPSDLRRGARRAWRAKRPFAPVRGEVMSNTNNRVFAAQHLEWLTSPYVYPQTNEPVFPRVYWRLGNTITPLTPDPADANAMRQWSYNAEDGSYTVKLTGYTSDQMPDLSGQNTLTIYPLAGVVVFSKPIDSGEILVDYIPQILRVAASPQLEASPCAFIDTRVGPAQSPIVRRRPDNNQYEFPRTFTFPNGRPVPRDRMWAFWTRVAPQVANPTVWAKTMRLMIQLPSAIEAAAGSNVTVTDEFGRNITQFTVDPEAGRLYFPTYQDNNGAGFSLEGRKVTVNYRAVGGGTGGQPPDPYIRWHDEQPEAPLPIDVIANEGKVLAFPDLALDPNDVGLGNYLNDMGTWRVWVFWTSSRPKTTMIAGDPNDVTTHQPVVFSTDTDLRYMTLAPRLDFRPTLPPP